MVLDDFLDAAPILAELRVASGGAASVYGAATGARHAPAVRRTTRIDAPPAIRDLVMQRLLDRMHEIARHFDVALGGCEEPQFLRYDVGDYFVAHQDGNTPLMLLDQQQGRLVSIVIFLTGREEYDGGDLVIHTRTERHPVAVRAGRLFAFRSETTHEVTPVTRGERYTIAAFFTRASRPS